MSEIKQPLVTLDENGQASVLNYNLPESVSYGAVGFIGLELDNTSFKPEFLTSSEAAFWQTLKDETLEEIIKKLKDEVYHDVQFEYPIFANRELLKYLDWTKPIKTLDPKFLGGVGTGAYSDGGTIGTLDDDISTLYPFYPGSVEYILADIAAKIKEGFRPVLERKFYGKPTITYVAAPSEAKPQIALEMNYKMSSYLGDYGAGRTVKTLSLLPGEKTSISIKTYTQDTETKTKSQNVLDSFSESSSEDLQNTVSNETNNFTSDATASSKVKSFDWSVDTDFKIGLGFFKAKGRAHAGGSNEKFQSANSIIENQINALVSSTDQHVSKSDSLRQIDVNTESTSTTESGFEQNITRELENINKSRVLSFVFRQLLQEYFTVTYLDDVALVFTNGYEESKRKVKLNRIDELLEEILVDQTAVDAVKDQIFAYLCNIKDHTGTSTQFIEQVDDTIVNLLDTGATPESISYVRKKSDLTQTYQTKDVSGVILSVDHRIIRTPAVIVDAVLGQGEALDTYNVLLQQAATTQAELDNQKSQQAMDVITGLTDVKDKVLYFNRVHGDCCDIAQSGCGCSDEYVQP